MISRILLFIFMTIALLPAVEWKPVTPEQLSLKTPKLDPNADAEAIFWEAWVEDLVTSGSYGTHKVENYKRIKIYNQRGAEKWGDVQIPYFNEMKMTLTAIRARTIKPDGTIIEVKGNTIRDTTVAKTGRRKLAQAKSFAFPALEPGSIIEYQYTEVYSEFLPQYVELPMQLEVPAWEVQYYVRPLQHPGFPYAMRYYPFNCQPTPWESPKNNVRQGFMRTSVTSVPALTDEPRMPDDKDVKAWILLYYTESSQDKAEKYWRSLGKQILEPFKRDVKNSGEIKTLAAEITKDMNTPDEKANALAAWVQKNIRNVFYNAEGMTSEDKDHYWKKLYRPEYNASDTLKNKIGTPTDIRRLYFSLAQVAGLDPLLVKATSANGPLFRPDLFDSYLLKNELIAFKRGENYRYYNPGVPYLPPGLLDWDEEGQVALVIDPKEGGKLVQIQPSLSTDSALQRNAKLTLSPEGAISGDIQMRYFGHAGVNQKLLLEDTSAGSREETIKKQMEERFPGAQITNLKIENANTTAGVYSISFHMEMENYAQRTGKRMFFQPGLFQLGDRPLFSASSRKYPIVFRYAYTETDTVEISLPDGFDLESPEMPGQLNLGKVGTHSVTALLSGDKRTITAKRRMTWGDNSVNYFEAKYYAALKEAWDAMHKSDTHSLTLKAN
jgi:hypothetical protein